tara:strand:+ start:321 stop:554 length:234 start_codon:yes stop_codon:yes gene_type:complete
MVNRYLYRKNNGKNVSEDISLPITIDDLIKLLDETFPLINPQLDMSLSTIQRKAGQRDVVDWLLELKDRKDENVLRK